MEFRFLDDADNRTPAAANSSLTSDCGCLSEQALQAGCSNMATSQNPECDEFLRGEIEWKEIMEREIAKWRAERGGLSLEEKLEMWIDSRKPLHSVNQFDNGLVDGCTEVPSCGISDHCPPLPRLPEESVSVETEVRPALEDGKGKLIWLAKPDPNRHGVKRKATIPPAGDASELPVAALEKKPEEWSCALCQVSATSEKSFHIHLQGKKHMAKIAGLKAAPTMTCGGTTIAPPDGSSKRVRIEVAEATLEKETEKACCDENVAAHGSSPSMAEHKADAEPLFINTTNPDAIAAAKETLENGSGVVPAETNKNKEFSTPNVLKLAAFLL